MSNYVNTVYSEEKRPLSTYPEKLVNHLFHRFEMKEGMKFLEVGSGRGDHLRLFKEMGLETYGLDYSHESIDLNPDLNISQADLEKDTFQFPDNHFDVIYSKSFIEHLFDPTNFMKEAKRVLKPGGLLLTLVPDWEANMKIYFDDFSHRSPYTTYSLHDLCEMHGFRNIDVFKFRQLPVVWKYPVLNPVCTFLSVFTPHRSSIKFLRWSKELMIIGAARK